MSVPYVLHKLADVAGGIELWPQHEYRDKNSGGFRSVVFGEVFYKREHVFSFLESVLLSWHRGNREKILNIFGTKPGNQTNGQIHFLHISASLIVQCSSASLQSQGNLQGRVHCEQPGWCVWICRALDEYHQSIEWQRQGRCWLPILHKRKKNEGVAR